MKQLLAILALLLSGVGLAQKAGVEKSPTGLWMVQFNDPPVARFTGFDPGHPKAGALKATALSQTGARKLDMKSADSVAYASYLRQQQDDVIDSLPGSVKAGNLRHRYLAVFNGVAMPLSPEQVSALRKDPRVRSVQPDRIHRFQTDAGPAWIGAEDLWNGAGSGIVNQGEGVVVGILDSGINWAHPSFAATGSDGYTHTNPRNGFLGLCGSGAVNACTSKLIGVHDHTNEGSNGFDTNSHGTHVASIAAGNVVMAQLDGQSLPQPVDLTLSGVAPHANVVSYKVCTDDGDSGSCPGSSMVAGIEQAVIDQMDVINLSIGGFPANGVPNNGFSPWNDGPSLALLDARAAGVLPVVAAGNVGPLAGSVTTPGHSPWVLTAGNSTHDRQFVNDLVSFSGGDTDPPAPISGAGLTSGYGPAPILHAETVGHPLCGVGNDIDFPPSGASNPFGPSTFNGEIVVCDRGVYARVTKGFNVLQGGAGGYVLANTDEQGETIVADDHFLPGVHVGDQDGDVLRTWLSSGSGHVAEITGFSRQSQPALGDILNFSSSRGPGLPLGSMKPDLTAPGSGIYAANLPNAADQSNYAFKTGTSMASPHIAGAAALIMAAKPGWELDRVESALMTTGSIDNLRLEDSVTLAGPLARGGGRVDVVPASYARLWFPQSLQAYDNADPQSGGDPKNLNRPGLQNEDCGNGCSFTRRVRGAGSSGWQVEVDAPAGAEVTVTPMAFTVNSQNPEQQLDIAIDVSAPELIGTWVNGSVRLVFQGGGPTPDVRLPFAVFSTPPQLPSLQANSSGPAGSQVLNWGDVVPAEILMLDGVGLTVAERRGFNLTEDPTIFDPFDDEGGTRLFLVEVPEDSPLLMAEVLGSQALDIDLYVGKDGGGGDASRGELVCSSLSSGNNESCTIDNPDPGTWWVLIQNFNSGSQPGSNVQIAYGAVDPADDTLIATGPGIVTGAEASVPIDVHWNDGRMQTNDRWYGAVRVGSRSDLESNLGVIPVIVGKGITGQFDLTPLFSDVAHTVSLPSGQFNDGLFVDLPSDVDALSIDMSGAGGDVDLLVRAGQSPTGPADADFSASGAGSNHSLTIDTGDGLIPGRWYIAPSNVGGGEQTVTLTVQVTTTGGPIEFVRSNWFNPARDGHGADINRSANNIVVVWYTYLEDGTPVWYLASGPYTSSLWSAPLLRVVWDGALPYVTEVGRLGLTFNAADSVQFSWHLLDGVGSEPFQPLIAARDCVDDGGQAVNYSGHWFAPAESGYGSTIYTYADVEVHIHYLYDLLGVPRWVIGTNAPFGNEEVPLNQIIGFCPDCDAVPTIAEPAGTATRDYTSEQSANLSLDVSFSGPVPGGWQRENLSISPLTAPVTCQ